MDDHFHHLTQKIFFVHLCNTSVFNMYSVFAKNIFLVFIFDRSYF